MTFEQSPDETAGELRTPSGATYEGETLIRPRGPWAVVDVRELWRFRDLLASFAVRDLRLRYRQTALGAAWVVVQPLVGAAIFTFVFAKVAGLPSEDVPYLLLSYTGLVAWTLFSGILTKSSTSLVGNASLVSKVYFPRLLLPLSVVASGLVDLAVAVAVLAVLMGVYGVAPGLGLLLLPVWLLLLIVLALGVGLLACSLMVRYRDVQYVLPVLTQFLLFGSPVAYALSAVPEHLQVFVAANPLTGLLEGFRWSLLDTGAPPVGAVAWSAAFACVAFGLGSLAFASLEREFADVI